MRKGGREGGDNKKQLTLVDNVGGSRRRRSIVKHQAPDQDEG